MLLSRTVSRPDLDLHIRRRPGTPTVVLLHGLAGTGTEWRAVIDALPGSTGIAAPDLRAHGRSRGDGAVPISAEAFTHDTIEVIEATATGRVVLAGQSMGGVVATRVAAQRPELVSHLVLVDAGIAALDRDLSGLERWLRANDTGHDPDAMMETIRAIADDSRTVEWRSIACPITVVLAQRTNVAPDDIARMGELQPETRWVSVRGSGHDIHLDQPDALAALLAESCKNDEGPGRGPDLRTNQLRM